MRIYAFLIIAAALLASTISSHAILLKRGGAISASYTDFCSMAFVSGTCTYAYDVQQRQVSTNTVPFQLTRLSDSSTHNAAYTGSTFTVNVSDLTTFCLGNGGTTTTLTYSTQYNDCVITTVYDQVGTGCDLVAGGPSTLGTTHAPPLQIRLSDGKPAIIVAAQNPATSPSAKFLYNNSSACTSLDGTAAKTLVARGNNAYFSGCCGQYGKIEVAPAPGNTPAGSMYSVGYYHNGASVLYAGDMEGGGICEAAGSILLTPVIDDVGVIAWSTTAGGSNIYYNNVQKGASPCAPFTTPATQQGMVIGCSGDYTACGPMYFQSMIFLNIDASLTAGLPTQIYNALASGQTVTSVQLANENLPVGASTGTVIGALSAKVTGGGACVGCTFTMVNSGASSDGSLPINCGASSNDFQVVTSGPDPVDLANLNVINTAQIYGQVDALSPLHSYICVKATPPSGTSWTQPFSIMVRNPTFTAFGPLFVQYTTGVGKTVPLSTTMCWTHCGGAGAQPTVTYVLGGDAACTASGLSISGSNLIFSTSYTVPNVGAGGANCHITATAAGVGTGMIGTSGSSYVADVHISQGAYVGPGDATYPNGASKLIWTTWTGPYAYSAAYATAGSPVWYIQREGDQSFFTINALANGDMDFNTLATDCDTSICYVNLAFDQTGNSPSCTVTSPANCMPSWEQSTAPPLGITTRKPVVIFDVFDGTRLSPTNSNSTDRFLWNLSTYSGSGATGTLWIDAEENSSAFGGSVIEMAATGTGSNPYVQLGFVNTTGAILYVGSNNHATAVSQMAAAASPATLHSMIGVVNGVSSVLKVDGAETVVTIGTLSGPVSGSTFGTLTANTTLPTGTYSVTDSLAQLTSQALVTVTNGSSAVTFAVSQTLSSGDVLTMGSLLTASLIKPLGFGGGYGGGSDQGYIPGPAAVSSTTASSSQRQALCLFDQWTYATVGSC
jgi:hypothetical protein